MRARNARIPCFLVTAQPTNGVNKMLRRIGLPGSFAARYAYSPKKINAEP
jgi:hypothetical protein